MPDLLTRCPICGAPAFRSRVICRECSSRLDSECFDSFMDRCPVCFYPRVASLYRCRRCKGKEGAVARVFPVARYDGRLSYAVIDGLKFRGQRELARVAALYLGRALDVLDPEGKALIVPVPCSASRMAHFGYDHMADVCRELGREFLPLIVNRSSGPAVQQKKLDREHRIGSSADKFCINKEMKDIGSLKSRRVIVVDDIVTTMSTMNAAIALLEDEGFEDVSGASWLAEL